MSRNATQLKTIVRRLRRLTALTGAVAIVFAAATAAPAMAYQDLRSPDASEASAQSSVKYGRPSAPPVPQPVQDLRSPDASDAGSAVASGSGSSSGGSSGSFEWGYLAVAGFAALVIGGSMTVVRRRRTRRLVPTH
jgi:hypothetical protein